MKSLFAATLLLMGSTAARADADFLKICVGSLQTAAERLEPTERVNGNLKIMLSTVPSPFVFPFKRYTGTPYPYAPDRVIDTNELEKKTNEKNALLSKRREVLKTEFRKLDDQIDDGLFLRGNQSPRRRAVLDALRGDVRSKIAKIESEIRFNQTILNEVKALGKSLDTPEKLLQHLAKKEWAKTKTFESLRTSIDRDVTLYEGRVRDYEQRVAREQSPTKKVKLQAELADRKARVASLKKAQAEFANTISLRQFSTVEQFLTSRLGSKLAVEAVPEVGRYVMQRSLEGSGLFPKSFALPTMSRTRFFKALGILGIGAFAFLGSETQALAAPVDQEKMEDLARDPRRMLQLVKAGTYTAAEVCRLADTEPAFRYTVDNAIWSVSTYSVGSEKAEDLIPDIGSIDYLDDGTSSSTETQSSPSGPR
jgi:hypothetical protein